MFYRNAKRLIRLDFVEALFGVLLMGGMWSALLGGAAWISHRLTF